MMKSAILSKMINYQSETNLWIKIELMSAKRSHFNAVEWRKNERVFLKLFESQETYQVFESQYSNIRKPLRISFI